MDQLEWSFWYWYWHFEWFVDNYDDDGGGGSAPSILSSLSIVPLLAKLSIAEWSHKSRPFVCFDKIVCAFVSTLR